MKPFFKFLGTVVLSVFLADGLIVSHMMYETSKYVPPPTIEQHLANTVSIQNMDGEYCSGWVLRGSHTIVTAAHCAPEDKTSILAVDFGDGKMHPFHIEKLGDNTYSQGPDLMTLTTNDTTVPWPAGEAVCSFKPYYGEVLTLLGGPLGYDKSATIGKVSYPDRNLDDLVMGPFGHFIQYDGALLPGNSGGMAVDNETGCVMGVADFIRVASPGSDVPFGVNYLTPASELSALH